MEASGKMSSMIELVKSISTKSQYETLTITRSEYNQLVNELWLIDEFLKKKYVNAESIPQMFSLFGVKLIINQEY